MHLFATQGDDGTTNRAIAEGAGLSGAAIYHDVDSQAELYAAVLEATDRMNRDDPTAPAFVVGVAGDAQRHRSSRG